MRMKAIVAGVGMTRFGRHLETGLKALGAEAVEAALDDSGLEAADLEAAYVSNAKVSTGCYDAGLAQIVELAEQLQGRCGERQIEAAKAALAHNGGGVVGREAASMCVTILIR